MVSTRLVFHLPCPHVYSDSDVKCSCGFPAGTRTVVKDGPNKGRKFYMCEMQGCKYFQFVDEPPPTGVPAKRTYSNVGSHPFPYATIYIDFRAMSEKEVGVAQKPRMNAINAARVDIGLVVSPTLTASAHYHVCSQIARIQPWIRISDGVSDRNRAGVGPHPIARLVSNAISLGIGQIVSTRVVAIF